MLRDQVYEEVRGGVWDSRSAQIHGQGAMYNSWGGDAFNGPMTSFCFRIRRYARYLAHAMVTRAIAPWRMLV